MNMSPKTQGCGVIEWKVYGYAENVIDKTLLKRQLTVQMRWILQNIELTEEDKAALTEAIQEAVPAATEWAFSFAYPAASSSTSTTPARIKFSAAGASVKAPISA